MSLSYRDSGVDLDVYEESMRRLPKLMHRTFSPRVIRNDGGFAGLYALDFPQALFARKYREPILVSGTDGVGTKLRVAMLAGRHQHVGIDLVAMCVNDVICTGAEPLFFLDYVAMGKDDPSQLEQIVQGISDGCVQADMSLLGGETAIMPDSYPAGEYDLAGFAVAVVEKRQMITGQAIAPDDLVLGIASNGLHSNGYSLVRKIVFDHAGLQASDFVDELGERVEDALLRPTQIYTSGIRCVLNHYRVKNVVHGIAHITGGGLLENTERILPSNVDFVFNRESWTVPTIFQWLQRLGNVDPDEMVRVFNMGIGMTLAVSPFYLATIQDLLSKCGFQSWVIGKATAGHGKSRWA